MVEVSRKIVKNLLKRYKIQPSKRFGQNFLIDKRAIRKIIASAKLCPKDVILEIGPGTGILTKELAKKAKRIIAIEKDFKMIEILEEEVKSFKNIKIIQGDILKYEAGSAKKRRDKTTLKSSDFRLQTSYKVVANLPYYIVAPVIRKFLESKKPPKEMILMVQKEVAQRICAKPPNMNLLALSVQFYAKPEIIGYISKKSFWPQPKVDSAITKLTVNKKRLTADKDSFFKIVKAGFSRPRKQIINNLAKRLKINREKIRNWLLKNKIQAERRAETLNLKDWQRLTRTFAF